MLRRWAIGFTLPANHPGGQKRFPISLSVITFHSGAAADAPESIVENRTPPLELYLNGQSA